jgi:hypothetical protein
MLIPITSDLDTPLVAPLDDAAFEAVEEEVMGRTGLVGVEESLVDVDDPVPALVTPFDVEGTVLEVAPALLEAALTLPEGDVGLDVTGDTGLALDAEGLTPGVRGSDVELALSVGF